MYVCMHNYPQSFFLPLHHQKDKSPISLYTYFFILGIFLKCMVLYKSAYLFVFP